LKEKLILFCARIDAHAGVVLDMLGEHYQYDVVGFFDDNQKLYKKSVAGIPILGRIQSFPENLPDGVNKFFVCTGNNEVRLSCYNLIKSHGFELINIIHPSAIISKDTQIGEGAFIGANVSITNNVNIGNCVLINTGATIEHDNTIEDFVNVSSHSVTAGRVIIRSCTFLGVGVTVIPDIIIGENAYIGAGSVVTKDVSPNSKVVGVPARPI
jgi:sugar O-acyltransferase (sialic acid O-acetyltransferase NeuD family)